MLEINIGATVECNGRDAGRVERVVLDRETYEATHLVIRYGGPLKSRHLLMPMEWIVSAEHDRVRTDHAEEEIAGLPSFEVQHYIRLDEMDQEQQEHPRARIKPADWVNYFVPLVAHALGEPYSPPGVVVTDQMLAPSESAIRRGLAVESNDGHKIGEVQEVFLDKPDWRLSGIVIKRSLLNVVGDMLRGDMEMLRTGLTPARGEAPKGALRVPADWVAHIERDRIVLNRSKQQVDDWEREQAS
ncbi:MAG: PRC-barrel domain-containing protein [Blastocatellia bacterium]